LSIAASVCTWNSGIVAFDSAILRAISRCVRVGSTRRVAPFAVPPSCPAVLGPASAARSVVTAARGAAAVRSCGGAAIPAALSTSARSTRPRGPLPATAANSISCTRAARRASGVASTFPCGGSEVRAAPLAAACDGPAYIPWLPEPGIEAPESAP